MTDRSNAKTLISLATYNERENIAIITKEIFDGVPDADVLVIDDNSPDGTGDWVAEQMVAEPRLKLLRRSGKLGLGTATIAAMRYAMENGYEYLLNLDADLSHPPRYIPAILAKADEGVDVVIGSRYVSGGRIEGWSFYRQVMSRLVNGYAKLLLGLKTRDNSGSFRCYRVSALRKINLDRIVSPGYSYLEEILFRLKQANVTFAEVPITFEERRFGKSKINGKEALDALWIILKIFAGSVWERGEADHQTFRKAIIMERTLVLLKPDTVARRLIGEIISRLERKGLTIAAMRMLVITPELAKHHYAEHQTKEFYPYLVQYISSGPVVAMIVEGSEAVKVVRQMIGPTNGVDAPAGTIRGDYSLSSQENLVHASDSQESALREIGIFFGE